MSTTEGLRFPLDPSIPIDEEALDAAIEERLVLANDLSSRSVRASQEAAALSQLKATLEWLAKLSADGLSLISSETNEP